MNLRFLIIPLLLFSTRIYAQTEAPAVQFGATPTVAALAKYADTPVGNYSGIPSIGIPLYSINAGGYQLPISLSYHAGGIKLAQEASWVGLGWSLNAGGMITRQIRGENDIDTGDNNLRSYIDSYGDYDKIHSIGFHTCFDELGEVWEDYGIFFGPCHFLPPANTDWEVLYLEKTWNPLSYFYKDEFVEITRSNEHRKVSDTEPDLFMFNFGGFSGKFIMQTIDSNGTIRGKLLNNEYNLKIELLDRYTNPYFKVTDPEGTIYEFNKRDKSTTSSTPYNRLHISGWLLTKITTNTKQEIFFEYEEDENYIHNISRVSESVDYRVIPNNSSTQPEKWIKLVNTTNELIVDNLSHKVTGSTSINAVSNLLKRIVWDGGKVEFTTTNRDDYGTGYAKKLSNIEIFDNDLNLIKKIDFEHDYFNADAAGTQSQKKKLKRLKLLELKETNINNTQESLPPYKFTYHEEKPLAPKNSNGFDHWGYYNGKSTGSSIPEIITFDNEKRSSFGGADRRASFNNTVLGTLKEIEYPTGGKVKYEYELNEFYGGGVNLPRIIKRKESLPIRNYLSHSTPSFTPKELDTTTGAYPNYREFTITADDVVESFTLSIDIAKEFYDYASQFSNVFFLNLYKLQGNQEIPIESIALHSFAQNMPPWTEYEPFRSFEKEFDYGFPEGDYRVRFSNMQPSYQDNLALLDQYLTGNLEFIYTSKTKAQVVQGYKAGGLRVKQITSPKNIRIFSYKEKIRIDNEYQETSSGVLLSNPMYYHPFTKVPDDGSTYNVIRFKSDSNVPVAGGVQGNIVSYSSVKEEFIDVSNGNNNFSSIYSYYIDTESSNKPFAPIFSSSINSKLKSLTKLDSNDKKVEYTINYYEKYLIDKIQGLYLYDIYQIHSPYNYGINTRYLIPEELVLLTRTEHSVYEPSSSNKLIVSSISNFDYEVGDNSNLQLTTHRQLVNSESLLGNGEKQITKTYRPEEMLKYVSGLSQEQKNLMQDFIDQNRVNIPVQTMIYKEINGVEKLISTNRIEFKKLSNNIIVPKLFKTAKGYNTLEDKIEYIKYDSKGNILETKNIESGVHTTYIWGYNQTYPIAKIENATNNKILALSEFSTLNITNELSTVQEAALRTNTSLKEAMVTTYAYKELVGIQTVTDPRGRTTTYHYDDFNRLEYVTDNEDKVISKNEYYYKNQQ